MNSNKHFPLSIASVGDISFAGGFCKEPRRFETWIDGEILDALKADVTIGNLECVFLPEGEKWPQKLCLAEPAECVKALKYAGFNIVTLANNHILDYQGERGLLRTIEVLDKEGIIWCGAGRNLQEAQKPAIINIRGIQIAVFSRTYSGSNIKPPNNDSLPTLALFDLDEFKENIRKTRKEKNIDLIVLGMHWGLQNMHYHPPEIHDLALAIIDCGVDLLLGHHAHVIQGLLKYKQKYIFFGQGNFYFYPYPYPDDPVIPNGILYGPEAVKNRIAAVSRFTFTNQWKADIIMTRQNKNETVIRLEKDKSDILINKILDHWGKRCSFSFHISWRIMEICGIGRAIKRIVKRPNLKGILWFLNPVNWLRLLWHIAVKPNHA